jgi:hypothetical protein
MTALSVLVLLTTAVSVLPAAEGKKSIPFTVPMAGMRLEPELRNQVSGLTLTVEDAGWPALTMLGHPFDTFGDLVGPRRLAPGPFRFGTVRQANAGRLAAQHVNDVSNTLIFRDEKHELLKVTVTRLSPAILLETAAKEIELFGGADQPDSQRAFPVPLPPGTVKPLRWATPGADGKVLAGVLGNTPAVQFSLRNGSTRPVAAVTPSLAPARPSAPPPGGLGQTWLLLWYGAGSHFLSSKIPAVLMGNGFHEKPRSETVFQADVPLLLVFEKSPQSIELRPEGNTHRLLMTYPGPAGKMVMLPLFGHDVQAAETTEKWLRQFPAELKSRCDGWARRLGDFPVNVKEETTYDEQADRVACSETFAHVPVRPGGEKTVPVRPMLALGLQQELPAVLTPQPTDLKYATHFGPLLEVTGNRYAWHIDGLGKIVASRPVVGPATKRSAVLEKELSAEVDKVLSAGHLAPWVICGGMFSSHPTTYGKDPSATLYFLSEFLPLLPKAQQAKVRAYLAREAAAYSPDQVLQLKVTAGARREFPVIPQDLLENYDWSLGQRMTRPRQSDEYYEAVPSLFRAYGVARYDTATGQKPSKEALDFWRRAMRESLLGRDWATLGWFWGKYALLYPAAPDFAHPDYRHDYWQYTPRAIHRDAAGLIGYLRLCRLAGETGEAEAWGQLVRLLAFRFALVRYGRYMAESGLFRMPENPDAAKYLARSGDFSKAENHLEQVWEVNQHDVMMHSGASKISNDWYDGFVAPPENGNCNNQIVFADLTPEVGRILATWGLKEDAARYVEHYAEVQAVWYKSHSDSEHLASGELAYTLASDSYQYFVAHAWIAGTPPEQLEQYIDEPWVDIGDYFYLHKLAETAKAYRGVKWETETR